jgi:hypothetical protein
MTITTSTQRRVALAGALAAAALAAFGAARGEAGDGSVRPAEMVGGGWVPTADGERAHFQVGLPCPGTEAGTNPQGPHVRARFVVQVGGDRYVLDELTGAACAISDPEDRDGGTHQGSGLASCGGERGFNVDWRLTDGGVGNPDTAEVGIRSPGEEVACQNNLHIGGPHVKGNLRLVPAVQHEVR